MTKRSNHSKDADRLADHQLTRLYDDYYRALVGYAMQIVGNEDTARDIVQNIFQKVWERQVDMDTEAKIKAYLYNGVRNIALNTVRRKTAEVHYAEHIIRQYEEFYINPNGEEEFFTEEIYRLLFKKIDALSPRQREVFLLCMEGKTYKEISAALHISTETVKTQKQKAISRLKTELGELSFLLFFLLPY